MSSFAIPLLRIALAITICGSVLVQLIALPIYIGEVVAQHPEASTLATPYRWVVTLGIACIQVSLVAIWALLNKVQKQEIFSRKALPWVDTFIWATTTTSLLVMALGFHLLNVIKAGGPGVVLAVAGGAVIMATLALLMLVMRGLLVSATKLDAQSSMPT
ncbi:DUF2975 domain-containing protein [Glutamicibacter halophytocola]|uniref:DUF2975 domain-containing protein n=1 Tax=Glutamicibacter halophytocola TaxID=1933880 RepID=UPI0015589A3D|nr:DUF2975 domain-containing protein [Glutamicibacter halophytocola]NQD39398.1 DUF2975 domain-containing protein [Glutamicibacter halophytocola]